MGPGLQHACCASPRGKGSKVIPRHRSNLISSGSGAQPYAGFVRNASTSLTATLASAWE